MKLPITQVSGTYDIRSIVKSLQRCLVGYYINDINNLTEDEMDDIMESIITENECGFMAKMSIKKEQARNISKDSVLLETGWVESLPLSDLESNHDSEYTYGVFQWGPYELIICGTEC